METSELLKMNESRVLSYEAQSSCSSKMPRLFVDRYIFFSIRFSKLVCVNFFLTMAPLISSFASISYLLALHSCAIVSQMKYISFSQMKIVTGGRFLSTFLELVFGQKSLLPADLFGSQKRGQDLRHTDCYVRGKKKKTVEKGVRQTVCTGLFHCYSNIGFKVPVLHTINHSSYSGNDICYSQTTMDHY